MVIEVNTKDYVKNFAKRMLKTQLFIGTFQERRYVEPLNSYRDVVRIDDEESEFIENVVAVKKKIKDEIRHDASKGPMWIGLTDPNVLGAPVGYNLWVELPIEVFGKYWFQVRTVEFFEKEIRLKLDVVKAFKKENCSNVSENNDNTEFDLQEMFENGFIELKTCCLRWVKDYVTFDNIKQSLIFLSVLFGTIAAATFNLAHYLMEYSLRFMKELSVLIKTVTPICLSLIDLVWKTIYGFYALIVSLFSAKYYKPHNYATIRYRPQKNRALGY